MVQSLWKEFDSLIETSTLSFDDPVILLLGIYTKEIKIYIHKKTCTQKWIAVLFTLGKKNIEEMQISISWWVDRENDIPSIWKNYSTKDSSHKWQNVAWFIFTDCPEKVGNKEKVD